MEIWEDGEVTELLPPAEGGVNQNLSGKVDVTDMSPSEDLSPECRLAMTDCCCFFTDAFRCFLIFTL